MLCFIELKAKQSLDLKIHPELLHDTFLQSWRLNQVFILKFNQKIYFMRFYRLKAKPYIDPEICPEWRNAAFHKVRDKTKSDDQIRR